MNISTLQALPPAQITWSTSKAQEKEAGFLSLRLLNKRMRIRVSPLPLDLSVLDGKGNYFVLSCRKGWFIAIAKDFSGENKLVSSTLSDLRTSIQSSTTEGEDDLKPRRVVSIPGAPPTHLALGANDERLVVGHADGSISIYNTSNLFSDGEDTVQPLQMLPPAPPGPLRQIIRNPEDLPDLVAVRRDAESGSEGLAVEVLDVRNGQSVAGWRNAGTPETTPTAVAWSPKGKQIALGFRNGDIVTYNPSDTRTPKQHIPKPPQVGDASIISIIWLSNHAFYGIYTSPGDRSPETAQKHFLTVHDAKTNTAVQTQFETPYYPSPALRPPGAFSVVIRNWNPAKFLTFISDSTSGDIGVVGGLLEKDSGEETLCNISLEETSTPSLPLDKDDNDTIPLALELDETPAGAVDSKPPILYLYASDGTLQAWLISNSEGEFPSTVTASGMAATRSSSSVPEVSMSTDKPAAPAFSQPSTPAFGSTGFGSTAQTSAAGKASAPAFGGTGFPSVAQNNESQQKPAFGQISVPTFGTPAFGQPSVFGQASSTTSVFGQPSALGSQTSAFDAEPAVSSGFGAFANQGPTKFGSTGFGFGASPSPPASGPPNAASTAPSTSIDAASPEAEMSEADDGKTSGDFDGLSLGGASSSKADSSAVNSMFGSFAKPPASDQALSAFNTGTSAFGGASQQSSFGAFGNTQGSSFIKPASGFGAFSGFGKPAETPAQAPSSTANDAPKPSPAFGSSGFKATANGQPAFGQPAFGQSSFGALGKPASDATSIPASTSAASSGGFSAFAGSSKGFSAFAQGATNAFAQAAQTKPIDAKGSDSGAVSAPESSNKPTEPMNTFGGTKTSAFSGLSRQESKSSPFNGTSQATNAFGGGTFVTPSPQTSTGGAFSAPSAPSLATAPTTRMKTPESSPEGSPVADERPKLDKADLLTRDSPLSKAKLLPSEDAAKQATPSITPPSPFKTSSPAVTTGAFGNLTSTPSFFKPAEGFGAFGASAKVPSSSPFANPKPVTTSAFGSPVSVFGAGGSGSAFASATTPAKSLTTTPTFGSPSALGSTPAFGKPSFGTPVSTTPTTVPTKPATSAFSAYSGSGGFSAFAGAGKSSFSELLQSDKDEKQKAAASALVDKGDTTQGKSEHESKGVKPESSFVTIPKPGEIDHDNLPPTPSSHGTFDDEEEDVEGKEEEYEHDDTKSFISEQFSDEASEGEIEESEEEGEEEGEEGDEDEDEDEDAKTTGLSLTKTSVTPSSEGVTPKPTPAKDTGSETKPASSVFGEPGKASLFAKAPELSASSPFGQKPSADGAASPSSPAAPSLFGKPSTSASSPSPPIFGQPASPAADLTPTPSPFAKPASPSLVQSTTPPGSPKKEETSPSPLLAPKPVAPALSSASSLGLGRPSSRPTKSSPLANAPVTVEPEAAPQSTGPAPRPASPRKPFGQVDGALVKPEPITLSLPEPSDAQPVKTPPPFTTTPVKPPQLPPFSLTPAITRPPFSFPPATPASSTAVPGTPGARALFNVAQAGPSGGSLPPTRSLFGGPAQGVTPSPSPPAAVAPPVPKPQQQPAQQQEKLESDLQTACYQLCMMIRKELSDLSKHAQEAVATRERVGRSASISHTKADFSDKTKWAMGDIDVFARLLKGVEKDILAWYDFKAEIIPTMREVESNLLKAETRKEEIIRFSKAKADPEFAKMLKSRTLGPDANETRDQLRRQIRLVNDRVEQLEAHLKACRKKVEEHRKGRVSMKPPSLDTINRTYRNIDMAIEMQLQQINKLNERMSKLNLTSLSSAAASRRASLSPSTSINGRFNGSGPGSGFSASRSFTSGKGRFRAEVTPSIAASTAAALNAERSAMRLKLALAKVRTTPLMNTQAVDEPVRRVPTLEGRNPSQPSPAPSLNGLPCGPVNVAFPPPPPWNTPTPFNGGNDLNAGIGPSVRGIAPSTPSASNSPAFSADPDHSPEISPTSQRQTYRRFERHATHAKAPPLGKTHQKVPSEIWSFDFGPLPGAKPMETLSSDVRPEMSRKVS